VTLQRPKVRGAAEVFASRLLGIGVTRTHALESLVIAGFVRGLSVRDVEASLADALGPDSTVSKSTVSRICEAIKAEFDAWKTRDLSEVELDYLFADGSFFKMHPGAPAEPVLVAWGITTAGKPVFLGLEPGSAESRDAWAGFFRGLTARGLGDPLLVISDGGAGLIGAAELCFEHSLRQRCLIHRARNILAKVPVHAHARSRPTTGRSSTTSTPNPVPPRSRWPPAGPRRSLPSGASSTPQRSTASRVTSTTWSPTCASPPSTTTASGTPTSSSAPSARPADGSRSSVGSPGSAAA
jgi:hypothetical protein